MRTLPAECWWQLTTDTGLPYYINVLTRARQWEVPEGYIPTPYKLLPDQVQRALAFLGLTPQSALGGPQPGGQSTAAGSGQRTQGFGAQAARRQSMRPRGHVASVDRARTGRVSFYSARGPGEADPAGPRAPVASVGLNQRQRSSRLHLDGGGAANADAAAAVAPPSGIGLSSSGAAKVSPLDKLRVAARTVGARKQSAMNHEIQAGLARAVMGSSRRDAWDRTVQAARR